MTKKRILAVLLVFIVSFCCFAAKNSKAENSDMKAPLAIVNLKGSVPITEDQVTRTLEAFKKSGYDISREDVLESLINDEIILQAFKKDGYTKIVDEYTGKYIEAFKAQLVKEYGEGVLKDEKLDEKLDAMCTLQTGMNLHDYCEKQANQDVLMRYVYEKKEAAFKDLKEPSDADAQEYFNAHPEEMIQPLAVSVSHVFFALKDGSAESKNAAKDAATKAYKEIKAKKYTFEDCVKIYSADTQSRDNGGKIGVVAANDATVRKNMGDTFTDTVLAMQTGEIKVVESNAGYHLVLVNDRSEEKALEFESVKDAVKSYLAQSLSMQTFYKAYEELLTELKKDHVRYF